MLFYMKFGIGSFDYCAQIRLTLGLECSIVFWIVSIRLNFFLINRTIMRFFIAPDLPRDQKEILKHLPRRKHFLLLLLLQLQLIINIQNPRTFPHRHQISKGTPIITNLLLLTHELNNGIFLFQIQINLTHIFTLVPQYFIKHLFVWYLFGIGYRYQC